MAMRTSCPRATSAPGKEPTTSASPPTLTTGAASAARKRIFMIAKRSPPEAPALRQRGGSRPGRPQSFAHAGRTPGRRGSAPAGTPAVLLNGHDDAVLED